MNFTNRFHPASSLSFAHVLFVGFSLTYADSAHLRGYIAQDVAQLGRYYRFWLPAQDSGLSFGVYGLWLRV